MTVRIEKGQVGRFRWELNDWRVVGYEGHYRARSLWGLIGEQDARTTEWHEFEVVAAGDAGSRLAEACDNNDTLWADYKRFMNVPITVFTPVQGRGSSAMGDFVAGVASHLGRSRVRLSEEPALPDGLRRRLRLMELLEAASVASAKEDGPQKRAELDAIASHMDVVAIMDDYCGAIAKWQSVVFKRSGMTPQVARQAAEELVGQSRWMAVGRTFPRLMEACGVQDAVAGVSLPR